MYFRDGRLWQTLFVSMVLLLLPQWWRQYSAFALMRDVLLLSCIAVSLFVANRRGVRGAALPGMPPASLGVLGAFCLLFSVATIAHFPRFYFLRWTLSFSSGRSLATSGLLWFVALVAVSAFFLRRGAILARRDKVLAWVLVAGQVGAAAALLKATGGTAVYSDDHPSFMFRIAEFRGSFPWFENYVPHWNAGVVNSVLVSSGTPAYAWLAAPLWWLFPPHVAHTWAIILVQIWILPWMLVWALRNMGLSRDGALMGGLLNFCASRQFFVWMLHFGTMGAAVSWAVAPSAFCFLYSATVGGRRDKGTLAGLLASLFFMSQWMPTVLIAPLWLVLGASALLWRRDGWGSFWALCAVVGVLGGLLAHNLWAVLGGRDLLAYTLTGPASQSPGPAAWWREFSRTVADNLVEMHPLTSVFGVAGAFALPWRRLRWWSVATLLGYALLFTIGPLLAPRMQLERLAIVAAGLAVVPAACNLRRLFVYDGRAALGLQTIVSALLLAGVVSTVGVYGAQGFAPFTGVRPSVTRLVEWVRENVPEDGRLLFAGPTVHAYGRGHVAYLPILAGREMMSCDYYGFPSGMVEMDYPPRAERDGPGGMHGFMVLHGATHVITHQQRYIDYFRSLPEKFRERGWIDSEEGGGFAIFDVIGAPGRFAEGTGAVKADFNRWEVEVDDEMAESVAIRYNWSDRLRAEEPAELFPYETERDAVFIGIRPNGAKRFRIFYRNRF